jgi:hypothetical protein
MPRGFAKRRRNSEHYDEVYDHVKLPEALLSLKTALEEEDVSGRCVR